MTTIPAPTDSPVRTHGRGLLLSILEKEILLARIKVFGSGRFVAETQNWNSYWEPLRKLGHREVEDSLEALYSAWRDYIRTGFDSLLRRAFCFRYFLLLDVLLSNCGEATVPHAWARALQTALRFDALG